MKLQKMSVRMCNYVFATMKSQLYSTWWINNNFNLCFIVQHHAELFLGAMDTTFLLAYAAVSFVDLCQYILYEKKWKVVIFVVSCYTLHVVNEEFMRSFISKKERNAIVWHQSTRHGMVSNNWKKYLASNEVRVHIHFVPLSHFAVCHLKYFFFLG